MLRKYFQSFHASLGEPYGPFYGPNVFDKVCGQNKVKSMKIEHQKKDVADMVKICKGVSFSLHCDYVDIKVFFGPCFQHKEVTNKL